MYVDRVEEWKKFSKHMESYIRERTVDKYKMDDPAGVDLISMANPMVCIWNILRYSLRMWNGKMKQHDLEKVAHYASFAWTMNVGKVATKEPVKIHAKPAA